MIVKWDEVEEILFDQLVYLNKRSKAPSVSGKDIAEMSEAMVKIANLLLD